MIEKPAVTLIIPFFNEEFFIEQKLMNCLDLDYPNIEKIICVDDSSTDQSRMILRDIISKYTGTNIVLMRNIYSKGKTGALKTAFETVLTTYVAFTDADILLKKTAISELIENIENNPGTGLVFGEIERYNSIPQLLIHQLLRLLAKIDSSVSCTGQLYLFRKNLNIDIDEEIIADDLDIPLQVRKKHYACKPVPSAIFYDTRKELDDTVASKRRIIGVYQSFFKHRDLFFNLKYGKFGLICVPVMALFFPGMSLLALGFLGLINYYVGMFHPLLAVGMLGVIFGVKTFRNLIVYIVRTLSVIVWFLLTKDSKCKWRGKD